MAFGNYISQIVSRINSTNNPR